jgi:GNAT superfamily N-acetyltransferase
VRAHISEGAATHGFEIRPLALPSAGLDVPAAAARSEGHAFVDRLIAEWQAGRNRFDRTGERLLGAWRADDLAAVCGLNRDPYANDAQIGRLRHLYVGPSWRGTGLARRLIEALLAGPHPFRVIRLRTTSAAAAGMYEHLGFAPTAAADVTHIWRLQPRR